MPVSRSDLLNFCSGGLHDQRMVQKRGRVRPAEQAGQLDLAAGGRQQVDAADHQVHSLDEIVDRRGELIAPVAETVTHEQVAALVGRDLCLRPLEQVVEPLFPPGEAHTDRAARRFGQLLGLAGARIAQPRSRCRRFR